MIHAGCILLNADMTKLVLVKGWKGNSRGLPKGKINEGEPARDAALREASTVVVPGQSYAALSCDFHGSVCFDFWYEHFVCGVVPRK